MGDYGVNSYATLPSVTGSCIGLMWGSEDPVSSHGLAVFQIVQVLEKACVKSLRTGIHRIVRGVLNGH